ncbi:MAG: hypothetical protein NC408_04440 [Candidatus Gastranaerophilales bacterium]|nr:hypothetical protein [Candidatus Gastranaerophilales bacterium]MCM1072280.1 hypothetical protein [Bacteroides sp.]
MTNKTKTQKVTIKPTQEERIMGAQDTTKTVLIVDYTSHKVRYLVENLVKNRKYELNGYEIGAILGTDNTARQQLREGAKEVVLKDSKGKDTYKIEVIG